MTSHITQRSILRDAALAPATIKSYNRCLQEFITFTRRPLNQLLLMHATRIDFLLSSFIDHLYSTGSPYGSAVHALNGLVHQRLDLATKLSESHLRLRGWGRLKTSTSHPPITWELTVLIAVTLAQNGHHDQAMACLLAFDCYLRVGELTSLTYADIVMPHDPRMGRRFTGMAIRLAKTKTGLNQWVSIRDKQVQFVFYTWIRHTRARRDASDSDFVFPFSSAHFRRILHNTCVALGIGNRYVPHSFRHGGATADTLAGDTIEQVMYRGRWKSMESARRYIQTGRALLVTQHIPPELNRLGILFGDDLDAIMPHLFDTVANRLDARLAIPKRVRFHVDTKA